MTAPFSEARQVPPRAGRRAALPPALPVLIAALAAALVAARGAAADGRDGDLAALLEETGRAAKGILRDDRVLALHGLDVAAARASSLVAGAGPAADRRRAERLLARVGAARAVVADGATSPRAAWRRVRAVLAAAARARARLRRTDAPPPLDLRVPPATVLPAGGARTLRVEVQGRAAAVPGDATLVVVDEGPGVTLAGDPVALPGGGLRFRGGAGPGTALVIVSAGGVDRAFRWVNPGPRGALPATGPWGDSGDPPTAVTGIPPVVRLRVGGAAAVPTPSWEGGEPEGWTIDPPLPAGLSLDARTGATAGAPTAPASTTSHSITAWNPHGTVAATFDLQVAPALPAGMVELEDGWQAEVLHAGLAVPVKMARAPDGRLFFNELGGSVRVAGADGVLRGAPVAAISVVTGGERGLLGIAVAPDFATRPALFVFATTPAGDGLPERNRVLRLDLDGDVATATAVVVDQLPAGVLGNGGDVRFGPDGMLYVSLGDTGDPSLAQRDGERAGRVLRYAPDGSVPGDNPVPGDPEWCRGFRNPFDLEFHPVAGTLFATENGPAAHDELNLLLRGRNHEWEELPEDFPGSMVGVRLRDWTPVIVPTGLAFHPDGGDGGEGADALFVAGYDRADVRRLVMSGAAFTDVDEERPFARWSDEGLDHRPLDLVVTPDGDLLVSTFTAIWRLRKAP